MSLCKVVDDRNKKKCEYAVLVSLLEPDSELYNGGIVDVSYRYPKMYVIRPQFFIPLISLLVQMSRKNVGLQKELIQAKSLSVDITTFEGKLDEFKEKFGRDCRLAGTKFNEAIAAIDKSIRDLQTVRANLVSSEDHLRLANDKAEGLTIRKLTYKNHTMKAWFEEARKNASKSEEIKDENEDLNKAISIEEPVILEKESLNEEDNKTSNSGGYEVIAGDDPLTDAKKTDVIPESITSTVNRKALVGDIIVRTTDKLVAKVLKIETVPNGLEKLILEFNDGTKGSVYNNTRLYQVIE